MFNHICDILYVILFVMCKVLSEPEYPGYPQLHFQVSLSKVFPILFLLVSVLSTIYTSQLGRLTDSPAVYPASLHFKQSSNIYPAFILQELLKYFSSIRSSNIHSSSIILQAQIVQVFFKYSSRIHQAFFKHSLFKHPLFKHSSSLQTSGILQAFIH